jgi:hypothetical protein
MAPTTRSAEPPAPPLTVAVPDLILTWQDLLRAADPMRDPTPGRLRHLRNAGHVSPGIVVVPRTHRQLAGRSTFFSGLWPWVLRLRREDKSVDADRLEAAARAVEENFAVPIAEFLSSERLNDLHRAPFFTHLAEATVKALAAVPHAFEMVVVSGRVVDLHLAFGRVEGHAPSGEPAAVDLPSALLIGSGVAGGDLVWVLSRVVGATSLVEVVRAVAAQLNQTPPGLLWAVDDGTEADDQELSAAAVRYERGPAAPPEPSYVDAVLRAARANELPVRTLRLAG